MFGLGFGELIVIFLFALIFIGPKKLPELAKGLGKGIRDFQNAASGLSDHLKDEPESSSPEKKITDASQQTEEKAPPGPTSEKDSKLS